MHKKCAAKRGDYLWNARDLARLFKHELRIDARIVPTNPKEKMRPGGSTGRADAAQHVSRFYFLVNLNLYVCEMEIHADETVAMVDEHGVALEEHVLGHHYGSIRNS